MPLRFAVIFGSVRSNRRGLGVAHWITRAIEARGDEANLVDPIETPLPLLDLMYHQFPEGEVPPNIEAVHEVLDAADAMIVVSAEYNHGIPPALKNLLDHYRTEFHYKPVGIVTYSTGPYGGVRVAPHLRVVLGELGAVTPRTMVGVGRVLHALEEDGTLLDPAYEPRLERLLDELTWYGEALGAKREADGVPT